MSEENEIERIESQSRWLDCTGRHLGKERLKKVSRDWTPQDWEAYLSHLETPLKESLFWNFDSFMEAHGGAAPSYMFKEDSTGSSKRDDSVIRLRRAVKRLTPTQQKVVHLIFWNGLSERNAAKKMGLSRSSIQTHLSRAIGRLRELLSSSSPWVEGQKTHDDPKLWFRREVRNSTSVRSRRPSPKFKTKTNLSKEYFHAS